MGKDVEGSGCGLFLQRMKNLSQDNQPDHGWDSGWAPSESEFDVYSKIAV
jgi:hypothetical protein